MTRVVALLAALAAPAAVLAQDELCRIDGFTFGPGCVCYKAIDGEAKEKFRNAECRAFSTFVQPVGGQNEEIAAIAGLLGLSGTFWTEAERERGGSVYRWPDGSPVTNDGTTPITGIATRTCVAYNTDTGYFADNCARTWPVLCFDRRPISNNFSPWGEWGTCECNTQERTRTCVDECCIGIEKPDRLENFRTCTSTGDPPFEAWNPWQDCTVTCGQGNRRRTRDCAHMCCSSDDGLGILEFEQCFMQDCPCSIEGYNLATKPDGTLACTCTSDPSAREFRLTLLKRSRAVRYCIGNRGETYNGNLEYLPTIMNSPEERRLIWADASRTEGGRFKFRGTGGTGRTVRNLDNSLVEAPDSDPNQCLALVLPDMTYETQDCRFGRAYAVCQEPTPVTDFYSAWGEWGTCNDDCSTRTRTRTCDNDCCTDSAAFLTETEGCTLEDIELSEWGMWSPTGACSVTCGPGTMDAERTCGDGSAGTCCQVANTENAMTGTEMGSLPCMENEFDTWAPWEDGMCSESCAEGVQTQTREGVLMNGCGPNVGSATQDNVPCGEIVEWNHWGPWGPCSATCGFGDRVRMRDISGDPLCAAPPSGESTRVARCFDRC